MGDTELGRAECWSPWRYLRDRYPDVQVFETELPPGVLGCVDHRARVVWLAAGQTQAERRCTLAHELGHLALDVVGPSGLVRAAREHRVDAWAARRLITAEALADAMRWSPDVSEMAQELWVDECMVRARLRTLDDREQDMLMAVVRRLSARGGVAAAVMALGAAVAASSHWLLAAPASAVM